MTGNTAVEGLPYPTSSDFADVQDAFRLASAVDAGLRTDQAPLRAFMARPSFIGLSTSNSSTFTAGSLPLTWQTVEWDNTGGMTPGTFFWNQPLAQAPSWWMFGATIRTLPTSPVVGDLNMGTIAVTTSDQVTGISTVSNFRQRNDDTNTGGEWINMFAMAPIYHGFAECLLTVNGTTNKAISAGSRFWGMYLGPVTT